MTKSHCMRSNSPAVPLGAVSVLHIASAINCHDSRRRAHNCGHFRPTAPGLVVFFLLFFVFLLFLVVLFRFSVVFWLFYFIFLIFWWFVCYPILFLSARAFSGLKPSTLPVATRRVLGRSANSTFLPSTACFVAIWPVCRAGPCSPGPDAVRPVYSTCV